MTPFTADELILMVKVRDLLGEKRLSSQGTASYLLLGSAHSALLDVLRFSYLDTEDKA